MANNNIRLPDPANPNIEQILHAFLEEYATRFKPATRCKYKSVIQLFTVSMNNYGSQTLSEAESALFEQMYNARGKAHREFCQIFGPDKIPGNVGEFLGYFMPRKVLCGKELLRSSGTVMKKLGMWLNERGYINDEAAQIMTGSGTHAAKSLPAAEELGEKLYRYCQSHAPLEWTDLVEDYFTIKKVEPGKLYVSPLTPMDPGEDDPVVLSLPKTITDLCRVGWDISLAVGKTPRGWQIIESGSVTAA